VVRRVRRLFSLSLQYQPSNGPARIVCVAMASVVCAHRTVLPRVVSSARRMGPFGVHERTLDRDGVVSAGGVTAADNK
jgi:hypothetical protein